MYISGRPPVTNLYSSAVFIGWGVRAARAWSSSCIYRIGLGTVVGGGASASLTLLIAHYLGRDGDTLEMLQAVLDTNFWLATHVISSRSATPRPSSPGSSASLYIVARHVHAGAATRDVRQDAGPA